MKSLKKEYLFPQELLKDELSFILSPLLLRGKITTLYSPGGVGKSTFIYKIVKFLLDRGVVRKVLCFFADGDTTNDEFRALVERYYRPENLEESRFIPIFPSATWWRDFKKDVAEGAFKEGDIDLVVIDSLEQFFDLVGLDFFRNVGAFFSVLRRLAIQGVSVFVLHHTNKGGELAGRSTIINQSDVVYRLRKAGKFKWFGDAIKHRGAKLLGGKLDFYAELTNAGIEISSEVLDDRYGYVVQLVKQVLSGRDKPLVQYELIKEVRKLAQEQNNEIGVNKIRQVLHKFDGIYWEAQRGERNALEYSLLPPEIKSLSEEKKLLLDYIDSLLGEGIKELADFVKVGRFSFLSLVEIKEAIEEFSDKEALELLGKLQREFEEVPEF
jgi:hypothetical protein